MPKDLKVSQIGSSPLPPPFRGLHPPWVRKHCQIIFGCYFRKSSIPYNSVRKLMLTFLTSICDPLQGRTVCLEHKKRWFSIWDSFSLDFINWCALQNLVKKIRHFAWRTTGETRASCQLETDTGIKCALDSYYLENWWTTDSWGLQIVRHISEQKMEASRERQHFQIKLHILCKMYLWILARTGWPECQHHDMPTAKRTTASNGQHTKRFTWSVHENLVLHVMSDRVRV